MPINRDDVPSTRPYLIRALHEWCTDNGYAPYLAVHVDASVQVPREFVKNQEIVLNVSFDATSQLRLGNDVIEFKARFGGIARDVIVPVDHVVAIYARENGQGMAFPAPTPAALAGPSALPQGPASLSGPGGPAGLQLVSDVAAEPVQPSPAGSPTTPDAAPAGTTMPEGDDQGPSGAPVGAGRPALKRIK